MLFEEHNVSDIIKIKFVVDKKSIIDLANLATSQGRNYHIEKRYYFLRDQVVKERLKIEYYKTELQLIDILTKPLKQTRFEGLKN